mmetsp:Transcript_24372/g.41287  ORF Transcript_24372/g.41287 Transcript_24372/m.41287 type:complete len:151 (-) Transcript_24372:1111-1563(-)
MIKMMNEHNSMEQLKLKARSAQRVMGYGIAASSLQADLRAVLHSYVGKHVIAARRNSGSCTSSQLSSSTGTVVNSFIEKEKAYVVVEWHLCASKSVIRLRDFVRNGQFRVLDSRGAASSAKHTHSSSQSGQGNRRPSSAELKSKGVMKYT